MQLQNGFMKIFRGVKLNLHQKQWELRVKSAQKFGNSRKLGLKENYPRFKEQLAKNCKAN